MSMIDETRMTKDRDGWEARSRVKLDRYGFPGRILQITTSKAAGGGIYAHAMSATIKNGSFVWEIFGDWQKTLAKQPKTRCTEKSVKALHDLAISNVEALVEDCVAFYSKKEAA